MYEDSFEKRERLRRDVIASANHDCVNDRENCDNVHPLTQRCVIAPCPHPRDQEKMPAEWRNWMLNPKAAIFYFNRFTLRMESFNLSEAFSQMSTNGKLNVVHSIIENCLDENERSLLFADLTT